VEFILLKNQIKDLCGADDFSRYSPPSDKNSTKYSPKRTSKKGHNSLVYLFILRIL